MGLPERSSSENQILYASAVGLLHDKVEDLNEKTELLAAIGNDMQMQLSNLSKNTDRLQKCEMANSKRLSTLTEKVERLEKISDKGVLYVEIPKYSQEKATAMTGTQSFYTDDFYTDRHGYRMCARIYLNGVGAGKDIHLSIFFALKKGRYDNYLSWPFQRRVTFTLLNQAEKDHLSDAFRPDPASSSFQKPVKEMNTVSGFPMFVAHKVIENPEEGFLKNDMICLRVEVDPPS